MSGFTRNHTVYTWAARGLDPGTLGSGKWDI